MNNQENKNKQTQESQEGAPKTAQSAKPSFFAKRWTFPVIYLAASVLIVGLMYAKSQDAAPYDIKKTGEGASQQAGPVLPADDASKAANATPDFMWPVGDGGETATLSMGFYPENGSEEDRAAAVVSYDNTFTPHEGVDIGLKNDQPFNVVAAARGTVKTISEDPLMGHVVEIDHGNGYSTYYASLSSVEVEQGASVLAGQTIAKSGNNRFEKTEKNHLHFEMRKDGAPVDPNSILPKKPIGDNAKSTSTTPEATPATTSNDTDKAATGDKKDATDNSSTAPSTSSDSSKTGGTDASKSDASKTDASKPDASKTDGQDATQGDAAKTDANSNNDTHGSH